MQMHMHIGEGASFWWLTGPLMYRSTHWTAPTLVTSLMREHGLRVGGRSSLTAEIASRLVAGRTRYHRRTGALFPAILLEYHILREERTHEDVGV